MLNYIYKTTNDTDFPFYNGGYFLFLKIFKEQRSKHPGTWNIDTDL